MTGGRALGGVTGGKALGGVTGGRALGGVAGGVVEGFAEHVAAPGEEAAGSAAGGFGGELALVEQAIGEFFDGGWVGGEEVGGDDLDDCGLVDGSGVEFAFRGGAFGGVEQALSRDGEEGFVAFEVHEAEDSGGVDSVLGVAVGVAGEVGDGFEGSGSAGDGMQHPAHRVEVVGLGDVEGLHRVLVRIKRR